MTVASLGELSQRAVEGGFGLSVQRGRRLVEDENGGLADERARQRDALPLASRQRAAAFSGARVVAARAAT